MSGKECINYLDLGNLSVMYMYIESPTEHFKCLQWYLSVIPQWSWGKGRKYCSGKEKTEALPGVITATRAQPTAAERLVGGGRKIGGGLSRADLAYEEPVHYNKNKWVGGSCRQETACRKTNSQETRTCVRTTTPAGSEQWNSRAKAAERGAYADLLPKYLFPPYSALEGSVLLNGNDQRMFIKP